MFRSLVIPGRVLRLRGCVACLQRAFIDLLSAHRRRDGSRASSRSTSPTRHQLSLVKSIRWVPRVPPQTRVPRFPQGFHPFAASSLSKESGRQPGTVVEGQLDTHQLSSTGSRDSLPVCTGICMLLGFQRAVRGVRCFLALGRRLSYLPRNYP